MSGFEDYSPANVNAFEFGDPSQQADVMREAREQRIGVAENNQHFSAIHVNRALSEAGGITVLRLNSLFGNTANVDQQYIAAQYAAAFPEHGYVSIDLPAHGASDALTAEQRKSINKNGGSLHKVAASQVEAALDIVPNLKDVVLTGEAMGEFFAVEFAVQAAKKGITVRHLFGFDPLGMEDRSPVGLAAGYLTRAQISRSERSKEADDAGEQRLEDAFSKVFVPQMEQLGSTQEGSRAKHAGLLARERTILRLMFKKSPITRDTGMRALEEALDTQPQLKANLVFAGQSVVGRLTNPVKERLEALSNMSDGRLKFDEWPNDNQDIGLARHQPRLIKYVKDNLEAN